MAAQTVWKEQEEARQEALEEPTKKEQILELYGSGIEEVAELAMLTGASPSYIGSVLRQAELEPAYFDLYTPTAEQVSAYTKYFAGKLRFRDVAAARQSVAHIERLYQQFERRGDRAGQHHAMMMAMTMANRARWSNKKLEAQVFADWLVRRMREF